MGNVRKLKTLVSCVPAEFVLKEIRKWTEDFLNNVELVNFRISREQWLSIHQLSHDASDSPNVNFFSIRHVFRNKQQLGRPIPSCRNVISQFWVLSLVVVSGVRALVT